MHKISLFLFSMLIVTTGFADRFALNYQATDSTTHQKSKAAIQWASSAKEIEDSNIKIRQGIKLDSNRLQALSQVGKIEVNIPDKAEYFRVLLWSNGTGNPDLLTSWVAIIPNKTYTLTQDFFAPLALMSGMGC